MYSKNVKKNKDIPTNDQGLRLSYESDGKMGERESTLNQGNRKAEQKDFFNTTQSSE